MPDYFRFIQVLGSLDVDRNGVISESEIVDAPAALWALDTNGDGELMPEECGFRHASGDGVILDRARAAFMTIHPVLRAIDSIMTERSRLVKSGTPLPRFGVSIEAATAALQKANSFRIPSLPVWPNSC
jgi:hypothetical protein